MDTNTNGDSIKSVSKGYFFEELLVMLLILGALACGHSL
jgi:hypothetical protein